jgi:peptidoglycan hydrolase CwlO-like protein
MENYLSIEEASQYTSKSISSIRRLVKELKQSKSKHLKFEKLKTGHSKVFIAIALLDKDLSANSSTNDSFNSSMNNSNDTLLNKALDLLAKQLEEKDKQLEAKDRQIEASYQRIYESNVIIEQLQKKQLQLEENIPTKKRWFKF